MAAELVHRSEITPAVTDENRKRDVEAVFFDGAVEEQGSRFAAAAGADRIRRVGAVVRGVEVRVMSRQELDEPSMTALVVSDGKIATGDSRLIRDQDNGNTGLIQSCDRLRSLWKKFDLLGTCEVVHVPNDGPVAIEENDRWPMERGRR